MLHYHGGGGGRRKDVRGIICVGGWGGMNERPPNTNQKLTDPLTLLMMLYRLTMQCFSEEGVWRLYHTPWSWPWVHHCHGNGVRTSSHLPHWHGQWLPLQHCLSTQCAGTRHTGGMRPAQSTETERERERGVCIHTICNTLKKLNVSEQINFEAF